LIGIEQMIVHAMSVVDIAAAIIVMTKEPVTSQLLALLV
jgi:hypothetical protein